MGLAAFLLLSRSHKQTCQSCVQHFHRVKTQGMTTHTLSKHQPHRKSNYCVTMSGVGDKAGDQWMVDQ